MPLNANVYPGCDGHQLRHVIRFCGSTWFMVRPCGKASGNNCGNPAVATQAYFPLWLEHSCAKFNLFSDPTV